MVIAWNQTTFSVLYSLINVHYCSFFTFKYVHLSFTSVNDISFVCWLDTWRWYYVNATFHIFNKQRCTVSYLASEKMAKQSSLSLSLALFVMHTFIKIEIFLVCCVKIGWPNDGIDNDDKRMISAPMLQLRIEWNDRHEILFVLG